MSWIARGLFRQIMNEKAVYTMDAYSGELTGLANETSEDCNA